MSGSRHPAPGASARVAHPPDAAGPGHYPILAELAAVDGDLTPADEAERNNRREATQRWVAKLRAMVEAEPEWIHFDELYRTGLTGDLRTG